MEEEQRRTDDFINSGDTSNNDGGQKRRMSISLGANLLFGANKSQSTMSGGGGSDGGGGGEDVVATPMTTLRQTSSEPKSYSITVNSIHHSTNATTSSTAAATAATTTTRKYPKTTTGLFPKCITPQIIDQLRTYVHTICSQYHAPHRVPYHNVEHAYHVFLSANKLLDLMLCEHTDGKEDKLLLNVVNNPNNNNEEEDEKQQQKQPAQSTTTNTTNTNPRPKFRRSTLDSLLDHRPTYGIKSDPLTQLAFLFSALVHDVDHTGISNRQLVLESDDLAILYNDQSVAEQRSLAIAFSVLKRKEFGELRKVLFEGGGEVGGGGGSDNEEWFKFRKLVIDLVLVTDIASPERTQIVKSKWKEAFGEVIVAEKMKGKSGRLVGGRVVVGRKLSSDSTGGGGSGGDSSGRQDGGGIGVGGSNYGKGEGSSGSGGENTSNNTNSTPAGDRAVTRRFMRASLESVGRMNSQASILTADISLSSKSKMSDLEMKDACDDNDDDNDSTDARSIDISESSSISDMQSLDDDFDASAVSRSKMHFDPALHGDSGSLASNNANNPGEQLQPLKSNHQPQQQQSLSSPIKVASNVPRCEQQVARLGGNGRVRRSTGDLVDVINKQEVSDPPAPAQTRGRSRESKLPPNKRRSTFAVRGRLSQSVISRRDLPVPRARSEERRLGVRRALDLAGSTIVAYSDRRSSLRSSGGSEDQDVDFDLDDDWDEIDEFKATVVLEQMIRAADVAALLQDWNNVMKWSTRLYKELKNGFLSGRGDDPEIGWYDNQIKFFDFYIKPLAKNLGVMGVFHESVSHSFVDLVKSNLAQWIEDGELATMVMIKQDRKERGIKKESNRHQVETISPIDESESSKSSLEKSMGSLNLDNAVAEVKLTNMSASSTSLNSGPHINMLDDSDYLRDSFNSAATASTTNQSSTRLIAQILEQNGDE